MYNALRRKNFICDKISYGIFKCYKIHDFLLRVNVCFYVVYFFTR